MYNVSCIVCNLYLYTYKLYCFWNKVNLIKIRSTHLIPIFYRFFLVAACVGSNNTPLRVASGVNINALSEIYISQSEIESTSQNNQSKNRFLRLLNKETAMAACVITFLNKLIFSGCHSLKT